MFFLSGCFQKEDENTKLTAVHWIEDVSGMMTLDEILKKDLTTQWNDAPHQNFNLGFIDSAVWVSLPFENTKNIQNPMLLEVAFPLHDSIDVYLLDGNEIVKTFKTGDQRPFADRPIKHRNFLFPYTVPPKGKLRAIARIQTTDTMYLPLKVWQSNEFFAYDQQEVLLLGVFFGFLSIMLIYNLFLYISTHEKNYLYYSWCTASILYLQLTQKNLGYQYFWPDEVFLNHMSVPASTFMMIVTSAFFILKFLGLDEKQYAKTTFSFKLIIWLAFLGIIWGVMVIGAKSTVVSYTFIVLASAGLAAFATTIVMGILISLSIKGSRSAQLLAVAWFSLLAGSLVFALGRMGVPMPMILVENGMLIGSTFEAALISFALARHIKVEREARMLAQELALTNERKTREAQNSLLMLQERTTQQLEEEVQERTYKLELAMDDLTKANLKLDSLSRMDSLTGLSNRRNFDQEFNEAWLSCSRAKKPMSLLMADIDHFKAINDTYGHLFGDQCLIKVAGILKRCVSRPRDLAARFGGEEFIIMLPNTDEAGALSIAETIRAGIDNIRLSHEDITVKFTISIGIATLAPSIETSFIELNENADQALYLAKEGGRNRVVVYGQCPEKMALTL
jgi:diguanylate cyclase